MRAKASKWLASYAQGRETLAIHIGAACIPCTASAPCCIGGDPVTAWDASRVGDEFAC